MNAPEVIKELSCALLVESPAGWLIAHATGTPRWDLPKGRREPGELPIEAALRECLEETGLNFYAHREDLVDMGQHPYLPKKDLHMFKLSIQEVLDLSGCSCSTRCVRRDGVEVFETDAYAWVSPADIHTKVGQSLVRYLERLSLIPSADRGPALPRSAPR